MDNNLRVYTLSRSDDQGEVAYVATDLDKAIRIFAEMCCELNYTVEDITIDETGRVFEARASREYTSDVILQSFIPLDTDEADCISSSNTMPLDIYNLLKDSLR